MHVDSAGVESGNQKSDIGLDMLDARDVREEALWWIRDNRLGMKGRTQSRQTRPWEYSEEPGRRGGGMAKERGPGAVNRLRHQDSGARAGPRKVHTRPTKSCSKRSSTSQPGSERSGAEGAHGGGACGAMSGHDREMRKEGREGGSPGLAGPKQSSLGPIRLPSMGLTGVVGKRGTPTVGKEAIGIVSRVTHGQLQHAKGRAGTCVLATRRRHTVAVAVERVIKG